MMNFGLSDIINETIYGTPRKDLKDLSLKIQQLLNDDINDRTEECAPEKISKEGV